jgi:hypothetical protein
LHLTLLAPGSSKTLAPMNAPLRPEVLLRSAQEAPPPQQELPLASEGVQRYVWESRFGPMLIEVQGDEIFVNSQRVERCSPSA